VARVDPGPSGIRTDWLGRSALRLHLSEGVPFRLFTLQDPPRIVVDFREVDWTGVVVSDLLSMSEMVVDLRFGPYRTGWSRLVLDLAEGALPDDVEMAVDKSTGAAVLGFRIEPADPAEVAARAGVPDDVLWPEPKVDIPKPQLIQDDRFVVAIDPGHGGIDPGAERDGVSEKNLMLDIAFDLRDALIRAGVDEVVLTREADEFVSLQGRVALAHRSGADLFLSLHADALIEGGAHGATVYTLSGAASDKATEQLAARHNRADIIAGADLTGSDDEVASVLLDLARQETEPRSRALAERLVAGMAAAGAPMNRRPLREAGLSVLKSADIPSVLVEVGFLSSQRDLENLQDPEWRDTIIAGMVVAIMTWQENDAAFRALLRQ
jgi:N-acetylmuramoyl-L-alanine amidase